MAKILIVDDSRTSRKMLRNILESNGHEIIDEAVNGQEGEVSGIKAGCCYFRHYNAGRRRCGSIKDDQSTGSGVKGCYGNCSRTEKQNDRMHQSRC